MSNYIEELNEASFQEWFYNEFGIAEIVEMATHGPKSYPAFYHFADTSMLYDHYAPEIWALVERYAEDYLETSIIEALARGEDSENITDPEDFADRMVCLAASYLAIDLVANQAEPDDKPEAGKNKTEED